MVFSATCPSIPVEQVHAEVTAMSEDEFCRLQDDLFGRFRPAPPPTPETVEAGLSMLYEAIDSMPLSEKQAYMRAHESFPSLVLQESDPLVFLRDAEYDCWLAAGRLTEYWKMRFELFGDDKALLPMTQEGAMQEHMDLLYTPAKTIAAPAEPNARFTVHIDRDRLIRLPEGNRTIFVSGARTHKRRGTFVIYCKAFLYTHVQYLWFLL